MSFGDGNLRERVGDLNRQVDKLQRVNGELCAEINRQERRIRELESLVRDMFAVLDVHERHWRDDGEFTAHEHFEQRMKALGLEVDG